MGKLFFTRLGQLIAARPVSGVFRDPFGTNPALFLHAVQRWIERAFVGAEYFVGVLLDRRHNGVAVKTWPAGQNLENEQIERALEGVGFWHTVR